ncbi:MAG TPA: hypothetical protein VGX49_00360 [Jatrophihabitans sp.]|jgi:hypothetical protein|nr:hypothetical protein [Jatrophihabitans sp.]
MASTKPRAVGTVAATLILAATSLIWTSTDAAAYNECGITVSADHHSVTAACPPKPYATLFRVKTYVCATMYNYCGSDPVYSEWTWTGSWASVSVGSDYVDTARITIEYELP